MMANAMIRRLLEGARREPWRLLSDDLVRQFSLLSASPSLDGRNREWWRPGSAKDTGPGNRVRRGSHRRP